jgi:LPLT family lysophospholipid transporter-like MFS transporter
LWWGRRGGEAGDARDGCTLHACRDPDWRRGAYFLAAACVIACVCLLILIGILGGFFVVPLNALLQERGKQTVGAGNAIAVQNLGENLAMLLMLGLYSLAVKVGVPVVGIGVGFGGLFALAIAGLWIWQRRR